MTAAVTPARTLGSTPVVRSARQARAARLGVRVIALGYLLLLLALPVLTVFYRTFEHGFDPVLQALARPSFQHAFWITLAITAIVVPVNTVFGVITALALVRRSFPGKGLLNALIDLPFALSPIVIGLSAILVYGNQGWFGTALDELGIQVIFAMPGMILVTMFVCLPFVAREVIPVLREVGTDQEEAAYTLGASDWRTFWRVTLPSIRWGVIYGVILTTARALGEFGAVGIVSGRLSGKTETLTLHVEERYESFDMVGAYTASIVLAMMAVAVLLAMQLWQSGWLRRRKDDGDQGTAADEALR
jgi:sulfate transport system permease protein